MKNLFTILLLILSNFVNSQTYPILEPFNSVSAWTCTNGSGLQTYGPGLNYLTTNIGTTPYPNSSTITMTSPVYSFTNCVGVLSLSFPISGYIENGWDYMYFEYSTNGGTTWTTAVIHTGNRNNIYNYTLSNTINRFRFRLVTDGSVNSSGGSVFYYDIDYFNINCTNALPIELVSFEGYNYETYNYITWVCATETLNDYFKLERSNDALTWETINTVDGAGTSNVGTMYTYKDYNFTKNDYNYYRLTQVDYNGESKIFNIISVNNLLGNSDKKIVGITNMMGQEVSGDSDGVLIYYYSDGTHQKVCKIR